MSHNPNTGCYECQNSLVASFVGSIGEVQAERAADLSSETNVLKLAKEIVKMSIPLGIASVAQFSINPVLIAMVGNMVGVKQLGATALSFGLINATVFASAAGFCGALETMLSHTFGRDPNSKLYGIYAQRMAFLLLLIAILLAPLLACADIILNACGQSPDITVYVGQYCRVALVGVYPVMILELLRRYFACQHLSKPLSLNLLMGAAIFPFLLWMMIYFIGFYGAPISFCILTMGMMLGLLLHLYFSGVYKRSWGGWDRRALSNLKPMLRLALPSLAMMLSEWGSLEINALIAGYASSEGLAAFSVIYSLSGTFWSLVSGLFITAAVVVGNALGKGRVSQARRSAYICLFLSIVYATVNIVVMTLLRNVLPWLFTKDEVVVREFGRLVPYFLVYHFFDCFQSTMMGIFRGCGLQLVGAIGITLVLPVVGVPTGSLIFFFLVDRDVTALLMGPTLGMLVVGLPYYIYVTIYHIKWDKLELHETDVIYSYTDDDDKGPAAVTEGIPSTSGHDTSAGHLSRTHAADGMTMMEESPRLHMHRKGDVYACQEPISHDVMQHHSGKSDTACPSGVLENDLTTLSTIGCGGHTAGEGCENSNLPNASMTSLTCDVYISRRNVLMCAGTRIAAETTFRHVASREDGAEMHELGESAKRSHAKCHCSDGKARHDNDALVVVAEQASHLEEFTHSVPNTRAHH